MKVYKTSKKSNVTDLALNRSFVRKALAFFYRRGLEIRLHAPERIALKPEGARV
ncbi:MAG: hypothetical protein AB9861_20370 [Methanosarcina sp.]